MSSNHLSRQQHTLSQPIKVSGFGYWTGNDVTIEFRPGATHSGLVFVREDLANFHRIRVSAKNRVDMPRRTNLAHFGYSVEMVEHVVAALAGLHVDNCEIWTNGSEMPGCDGSSQPFASAILDAGIIQQNACCNAIQIGTTVRVGNEDSWVQADPLAPGDPAGSLFVQYTLDYGADGPIGRQSFEMTVEPSSFLAELAPARTFILKSEAEWLQQQGLGGRVTTQDLLVFDQDGPIDNPLRFEDECVRHKTLDLVGDLALAQRPLVGRITAYRSGHRLNAELVKAVLKQSSQPRMPLLSAA